MTDIKEIPVDPPEPTVEKEMEIENNTDNIEKNANIPDPETHVTKKKINKNDQAQEPETPAHPKKGRGRPKGAPNKPKPKQKIPEPEPEIEEPRRRAPKIINEEYYSPPPIDPTIQLLGILKNSLDQRQALKRQKYAGWVGRF